MKKPYKCEMCHDTGWYGDNGPGIQGNREYNPCECKSKPAEPIFENDVRWVWKWDDGSYSYGGNYAEKPGFDLDDSTDWKGKWVKVRFVEVKS